MKRKLIALCLMFFCLTAGMYAQSIWDITRLEKIKTSLSQPYYSVAYQELLKAADEELTKRPLSVMMKEKTPASGDKHDYMSQARYYWPDPSQPDGKPYISRDGISNPELEKLDRVRLGEMANSVTTLSLAYYFSNNEQYAQKATELIRVWFLNEDTRMNPNLNFAQVVPGRFNDQGRNYGVIDTYSFVEMLDAIQLLSQSKAFTAKDEKQLKEWFGKLLDWILTSKQGQEEGSQKNNHSVAYDAQVIAFALYNGNRKVAEKYLNEFPAKRIYAQIEPDGSQPEELTRTLAFHYSQYNLAHMIDIFLMGKKIGISIDQSTSADGRNFYKAVDFLTPYIDKDVSAWPYQQISGWKDKIQELCEDLYRIYTLNPSRTDYLKFYKANRILKPESRFNLLYVQADEVVSATNKTKLNDGWEFIRQDMANAWEVVRPAAYDSPQSVPLWTKVTLPHCFNAEDAVDPDMNYYQGAGWYRIALDIDNPYPNGRVILEFEGAGQKTDVYIYTAKVASHTGGYDGWRADITEAAAEFKQTDVCREQYNGKISIIIRCDNIRNTEQIPSDMSDFNLYGGLYRYVNLAYVPQISFQYIRADAVTDERGKSGNLHITTSLYNPTKSSDAATVTVRVKDPTGKEIYRNSLSQSLDKKDLDIVSFGLKNPILWSVDNPQLYTCELTLDINGFRTQAVERFGFRHYEFKEKGPFFLNGKRLLLKGTHRHEDHAGIGSAMTEELMIKEIKLIKDMGANFIRLGHYQQSDIILRLCDELGILVWEEIPWCRGGLGGEAYKEQARRMLTNMIEQHRNHPSIILWGLGNENDWAGDFETFDKDAIRSFMKELHKLAHQLDNGRLTSIRRCDFCKDIVDVYSPSIWAGWYSRAFRNYREMSDAGIENTTRFFHAEWGGDSHARRHAEGSFEEVSNAAKTGDWSESYIVRLFDWHLKEQEKMPQLSGSAFWTFKDFSTPLRPENPVPYVNQKGVVERDLTPKESYYVFQSYWTDKPMIHIYGHTWSVRWGEKNEKKEILVYSNCPEAELFVNGVSQGKKQRNSQDFPAAGLRWEVTLNEGTNSLRAVGFNKKQQITDEIRQEYQTEKWGEEAQIAITQTPLSNDTILIQAELKDKNGIRCLDSRKFIEFGIAGNGKLIQNQGTSVGSRKVQAYNGVACIKVAKFGKCAVSAKAGDSITNIFVME